MVYAILLIMLNINLTLFVCVVFSTRAAELSVPRDVFHSETIEEFISGGKMKLLI